MMFESRCIVSDELSWDDAVRVLSEKGWPLVQHEEALFEDGEEIRPERYVWKTEAMAGFVRLSKDFRPIVACFAQTAAEAVAAAEKLSLQVPIFGDPQAIFECWQGRGATSERLDALRCLGVIAPPMVEPRFLKVFETALQAPEEELRSAALHWLYWAKWPELLPLIERTAERDASEEVQWLAEAMLDLAQELGIHA